MSQIGQNIAVLSTWVDRANASLPPGHQRWQRIGKVGEEYGEVIAALIGVEGQNPRKGVTHTDADVRKELLDIAVTALGAYEHETGNEGGSVAALGLHVEALLERAGL